MAATIVYFGQHPSAILLQSSSNFNGSAQTGAPVLTPGLYQFPAQSGGGLYDFHTRVGTQESITILGISYQGGGTLTIQRKLTTVAGTPTTTIGTVTGQGDFALEEGGLTLSPSETLIFTSAGGTNPTIMVTASLTNACWAT